MQQAALSRWQLEVQGRNRKLQLPLFMYELAPGGIECLKALGPAATARLLAFKAESRASWMSDKAGTIAF